jgi:hypothetical protein
MLEILLARASSGATTLPPAGGWSETRACPYVLTPFNQQLLHQRQFILSAASNKWAQPDLLLTAGRPS